MTQPDTSDILGLDDGLPDLAALRRRAAAATDELWRVRSALGKRLDAGERVATAYDRAVRASEAADRLLGVWPRRWR